MTALPFALTRDIYCNRRRFSKFGSLYDRPTVCVNEKYGQHCNRERFSKFSSLHERPTVCVNDEILPLMLTRDIVVRCATALPSALSRDTRNVHFVMSSALPFKNYTSQTVKTCIRRHFQSYHAQNCIDDISPMVG